LNVLGIAGSLRAGSHNRALLRAAAELAPDGMEIAIWEGLRDVPSYDGDVEATTTPPAVGVLAAAVTAADGVLIATPEYNFGVPGVLKNALDWVSRESVGAPLRGKPVALAGVSPGGSGSARSQLELRPTLAAMGALVLASPNVLVGGSGAKFDASPALTDETTRDHLAGFLAAFADWIALVGRRG
jgi:chromate reductase